MGSREAGSFPTLREPGVICAARFFSSYQVRTLFALCSPRTAGRACEVRTHCKVLWTASVRRRRVKVRTPTHCSHLTVRARQPKRLVKIVKIRQVQPSGARLAAARCVPAIFSRLASAGNTGSQFGDLEM